MVAKFLDHSDRELKQWWRRRQRKRQKEIGLYQQKNNLARALCFFVHFLAVVARSPATWNFLILRSRFMEYKWTQHKNLFLFLNLDTVLSDSIPENFANIWQIKWNRIISIKFETVQIHFLSNVFGVLSSRNFATMATWRNDFSSLFFAQLSCSSHVGFLCWKLWLADFDSQVKNVKGQFVPAPPIEGTVLVNIADLMQRWTADKLKSSVRKLLVCSSLILTSGVKAGAMLTCISKSEWVQDIICLIDLFNEGGRSITRRLSPSPWIMPPSCMATIKGHNTHFRKRSLVKQCSNFFFLETSYAVLSRAGKQI